MSVLFSCLLLATALVGHTACWTWVYNRTHASAIPSEIVHRSEKFFVLSALMTLLLPSAMCWQHGVAWKQAEPSLLRSLGLIWISITCSMAAYVMMAWILRRTVKQDGGLMISNDTEQLDMVSAVGHRPVGDRRTAWQSRIPGNQILDVHLQHKVISIPNLPGELAGLRIAQVSDLHMTGQLEKAFFEVAIDRVNRWNADLVAVTGDLIDCAPCSAWVTEVLGRLKGRFGVYAILGNHDQRLSDVSVLRKAITDGGMIDIGGTSQIQNIRGANVLLAGNECPWFPPPPKLDAEPRDECDFSILLSHSPDTLPWAQAQKFDLMLAGHTHGGQIRFPVVGPVVCPSRFGVRYASGLFHAPPVVMHVNRGLSGVHTLRFNCPPELTLLELQPGA